MTLAVLDLFLGVLGQVRDGLLSLLGWLIATGEKLVILGGKLSEVNLTDVVHNVLFDSHLGRELHKISTKNVARSLHLDII